MLYDLFYMKSYDLDVGSQLDIARNDCGTRHCGVNTVELLGHFRFIWFISDSGLSRSSHAWRRTRAHR